VCATILVVTSQIVIGSADAKLDQRLSDELGILNARAVRGAAAVELTVHSLDEDGELLGGISGWTWQQAACIGLTWVRVDQRGSGVGSRLLESPSTGRQTCTSARTSDDM
jgi:hypothetical protein